MSLHCAATRTCIAGQPTPCCTMMDVSADDTERPSSLAGVYADELDENGRVIDTTSDNVQAEDTPSDCFTEAFYVRCPSCRGNPNSPFWQGWAALRLKTYRLIENKYFETAVIVMILISSMALVGQHELQLVFDVTVRPHFATDTPSWWDECLDGEERGKGKDQKYGIELFLIEDKGRERS